VVESFSFAIASGADEVRDERPPQGPRRII